MQRERFAAAVTHQLKGRRLIVVSNREPVVHLKREGRIETLIPASGLTSALAPVVSTCRGTWVAHGSGDADFEVADEKGRVDVVWDEPSSGRFRLRRVRLDKETEQGYYYGYANEGLWPLCHVAYTPPVFRKGDWEAYLNANREFARTVLDEVGSERAVVLVNDFHLAVLPEMLRKERPDLLVAHFWHIPWPSSETMQVCPQLETLLEGLLGNALLGFHIQQHCNNFLTTVDRTIEALVDWEGHVAQHDGHRTFVRPFPISIDVEEFRQAARAHAFEEIFPELAGRIGDRIVLLGVDRLDYTKGIPNRLRMFAAMLEMSPAMRGMTVFVQIGAPSRSVIPRYRALAEEVDALVVEINDRYSTSSWQPIEYLPEHQDRSRVAVLMRRAEACLVTSLHDGMNLVAKEYVAAQDDLAGTLVLSKFTGAARELPEACLVNPYDVDGSAALILQSLALPTEKRAEAMRRMLSHVARHDVYDWSRKFLRNLDEVARHKFARAYPGN